MNYRERILSCLLIAAACVAALPVRAQAPQDSAGIRTAALDYIEGWYDRDPERMRQALHPELAKRIVITDAQTGRSRLEHMHAATLIENTTGGAPAAKRRTEVRILDMFNNAAVVRVDALTWVDYLELAKWNDRWVIVNVLWELR